MFYSLILNKDFKNINVVFLRQLNRKLNIIFHLLRDDLLLLSQQYGVKCGIAKQLNNIDRSLSLKECGEQC